MALALLCCGLAPVALAGCAARPQPPPPADLVVLPETLPPDIHPLSREEEAFGQ